MYWSYITHHVRHCEMKLGYGAVEEKVVVV
jgi:hypothetical protein